MYNINVEQVISLTSAHGASVNPAPSSSLCRGLASSCLSSLNLCVSGIAYCPDALVIASLAKSISIGSRHWKKTPCHTVYTMWEIELSKYMARHYGGHAHH